MTSTVLKDVGRYFTATRIETMLEKLALNEQAETSSCPGDWWLDIKPIVTGDITANLNPSLLLLLLLKIIGIIWYYKTKHLSMWNSLCLSAVVVSNEDVGFADEKVHGFYSANSHVRVHHSLAVSIDEFLQAFGQLVDLFDLSS